MAQKKQFAASKLGGSAAEATASAAAHHGGIVGNFEKAIGDQTTTTFEHGNISGNFTEAVANPQPTPDKQPGKPLRAIPKGPTLQEVRPGDLITAQYFNNLVRAIENLRDRLGDIEDLVEDARSNNRIEDAQSFENRVAAD